MGEKNFFFWRCYTNENHSARKLLTGLATEARIA